MAETSQTPLVHELVAMLQHPRGANVRSHDLACPSLDELAQMHDREVRRGPDPLGAARRLALRDGIALLQESEDLRSALLANFGLNRNSSASASERNKAARKLASMTYDQWDKGARCRRMVLLYDLEECLGSLSSRDSAGGEGWASARRLDQAEFYWELTDAVGRAAIRLDLTHHEAMPPSLTGIGPKREYFEAIEAKTLAAEIPIRRIVAIPTIEKLDWVEGYMLGTFANVPSFHVRYTTFDHEQIPRNGPPPLSLQLVDDEFAFMANVDHGSHTEAGDDVDLLIQDAEVTRYLRRYYEAYWHGSIVVKEGLKINQPGLRALRKALTARG